MLEFVLIVLESAAYIIREPLYVQAAVVGTCATFTVQSCELI